MNVKPTTSPHKAGLIISASTAIICFVMLMPIVALLVESLSSLVMPNDADHTFSNLADSVLWVYIKNSLAIVSGTLLFACLFAIAPAWWCARYEFSGRRYLQWMMVFPLAIPAYISAYIYTDALDYAGPIQSSLRDFFAWQSPHDYWFFDIRSRWGASLMLGLALYPYIFLLLRNTFEQGSQSLSQAAQLMGASPRKIFWTIHLPLARPALAVGCTLVAMESLADYGTVQLFAINTLTTAIYDSWLVYGSLASAAKISCLTLLFVITLTALEKNSRKKQLHFDSRTGKTTEKTNASNTKTGIIWLFCGLVFCLGFLIPLITLIGYCTDYWLENMNDDVWQHSQSTFILATTAAFIATLLAILFNSQQRFTPNTQNQAKLSLSSLGYAIPGTVLAIGILIPLGQLDIWLNHFIQWLGFEKVGLIFSGTSFALILAFVIRFSAISNGSIQAVYKQMPTNLDSASTMLKASRFKTFHKIHLPIMRPALISAFLLVFIECVKELPASLLLRPFDFETLATYVYQFASDEQLEHAASSALLIIVVSLLPILLLSRSQKMQ
ncbi:Iron(III) ABC transporter, permease protein [Oleispira antarctica RB-8]|uniref:Iron(III) ABC transporter, permease protein n=1 Tax=Oleispira antarctica RB-8 TaxID=698738 RepID=R4YNE2_OLEAN|nr:Iron(III) ABC transporter, permease protein [Oleispira antarctica RB-8]